MAGWWFSPGISDSSSIKADGWLVVFNGRGIRNTRRKPPASQQL
jgi:hypothetical protein